ncbi:unnamed protein product, partial [Callosobruchus maculatus]
RGCSRTENVTCSTINYKSKYYSIFHGREIIHTRIAVTPEYIVNYECIGDKYAVEIFTIRKFRDEKIIQLAIEAARKIVDLPSPSVNLECNKLVT